MEVMDSLLPILKQLDKAWIVQVFLVVFGVLLFNFFVRRFFDRLHQKLEATRNPWDDAVIDALRRPLAILVWIVGLTFAVEIVATKMDAAIFSFIEPLRDVGVISVVAWFLIRLVKHVEQNLIASWEAGHEKIDHTTVDAIAKLIRVSILITSALVALQTLGINIAGVLAFGGIGGIAVGFAAKDLLANFFGGLMLYLDRPFTKGDWVRSPDREIEGTVEDIGWRLTKIRTFDKRALYVPNSTFASIAVENPSRMSHRRIYETIGVRYNDVQKLPEIVTKVQVMLKSHPEIDNSQTMIVNFNQFAPSSLNFFVYTFTHTTDWVRYHEIKQDVLFQIFNIIQQLGAQIAFPTSTIQIPQAISIESE